MCVECYGSILLWFWCDQPYHALTFQTGSIILFLTVLLFSSSCQFVLRKCSSLPFWKHLLLWKNFIWHPLIIISLFQFLVIRNIILKFINLLVRTKSPRYFCVLLIVSNFVFTMLLICQVTKMRIYGFMLHTYRNRTHIDI